MNRLCRLPTSVLLASVVAGCATAPPPKQAPKEAPLPPVVAAPPQVEKLREYLEVAPLELFFSGVRGQAKASESVSLKNDGPKPMQIDGLKVVGESEILFKIVGAPGMPAVLGPGKSLSFQVEFAPPAESDAGVARARVRVLRPGDDDGPPVDISALVTTGTAPADEPPLAKIFAAKGYSVNPGGPWKKLPRSPIGDEVKSSQFTRGKAGNVGMYLIARYTTDEDSVFGVYTLAPKAKPVLRPIGGAAKGHHQTLDPELTAESQTSFETDDAPFGLYLKVGKRVLFSNPEQNGGKQAARVYPVRSRNNHTIPGEYIVAFDEDGDDDFQDHVFYLVNVKPAE